MTKEHHTEESYQEYRLAVLLPFFAKYGVTVPVTPDGVLDVDAAFITLTQTHPEFFEHADPDRVEQFASRRRKSSLTKSRANRLTPRWYWPIKPAISTLNTRKFGRNKGLGQL